jgi:hypothetical protein
MSEFTRNIEELIPKIANNKVSLWKYIHRNLKQNVHFIETPHKGQNSILRKRGGHNKIDILLTEEAYTLLENSYNLRNRNITEITKNIHVVKILPCIESQTIGFIENTYLNCVETIRQFIIGDYRVDLYFPHYNIIIECDEFGHNDRCKNDELKREQYLLSLGNIIIRYNPNEINFDLSTVLRQINYIIMKNKNVN